MEKGRSRAARGSVLLAATVAAVLLGACSGPTNTTDATPERYVESPKVSDQARQAYGDGAEAAYRELAEFSMDEWLKTDVLDPAGRRAPARGVRGAAVPASGPDRSSTAGRGRRCDSAWIDGESWSSHSDERDSDAGRPRNALPASLEPGCCAPRAEPERLPSVEGRGEPSRARGPDRIGGSDSSSGSWP